VSRRRCTHNDAFAMRGLRVRFAGKSGLRWVDARICVGDIKAVRAHGFVETNCGELLSLGPATDPPAYELALALRLAEVAIMWEPGAIRRDMERTWIDLFAAARS
jgi:hypothetical protein